MRKRLGKLCLKSVRRAVLGVGMIGIMPLASATPACAAGDLLIAPTRLVLDGRRGAEVILNNIGNEEATYRVTLELRRMNDQGRLDDVDIEGATEREKAALELIRYAPRRVTLPPNQPQSIRIGLKPMDSMPDGEYRAHMLFRAIPKTAAAIDTAPNAGGDLKIQLIPIYGISIPVILRKGNLVATAAISNVRINNGNEGPTLDLDIVRKGDKSVFGEIHVTKPGMSEPITIAKGIAVYPEVSNRSVSLPITPEIAHRLNGEIIVSYYESPEAGGGLISQLRSVLR